LRTEKRLTLSFTTFAGSINYAAVFAKSWLHLCAVYNFTKRPCHIDATTELIDPLRHRTESCTPLLSLSELPHIEERYARVEQQRPNQLGGSDLGDATRIATYGVKVVIWDIVPEATSGAHGRRNDDGRIKLL
jgi:hypothetical protein